MSHNNNPMLGYAGKVKIQKAKILRLDMLTGEPIYGEPETVLEWFNNLLTNVGLDALAGAGDNLVFCRLGTSNTPPAFTDTSLGTQVGSSNTVGPTGAADGYSVDSTYVYKRVVRRFAAGVVAGLNLTEVGMGNTANGNIFSHALLKDMGGTPTVINLQPDEVLDVIYELRLYPNLNTLSTSAVIDGVNTDITIYPIGWGLTGTGASETGSPWLDRGRSLGGGLCCVTTSTSNTYQCFIPLENAPPANPTVAPGGIASAFTWAAYVPGSFQRNCTLVMSLTQGNFPTGIGGYKFNSSGGYYNTAAFGSGYGQWGYTFSPKIQKDATKTCTMVLGLTWGRHVP